MVLQREHADLTNEQLIHMYEAMLKARRVDERLWLLNRSGKIPFVISGQGQEAAQVGAVMALDLKKDYLAPYYRDLAIVLEAGLTIQDILLQAFAKAEDPNSGGRQMPGHFGSKKHRILSISSPVTTQLVHMAGILYAAKLKKDDIIGFTSLGEGSTNQGDFHEGLNFAGVHKLPLIVFIENNQYAISTPFEQQVASENVAIRAKSYGMHGEVVNGNDPIVVYKAVKEAVERAKSGQGGTIIEAVCDRLTPHSSDDDHKLYRPNEEIEAMKKKDALLQFELYLKQSGVLTDTHIAQIEQALKEEINHATKYAEQAPFATAQSALWHVYEGDDHHANT